MWLSRLAILFLCFAYLKCSPILDVRVKRMKLNDGKLFLLNYIDMPLNMKESATLSCQTPLATNYNWKISAKRGSPHASDVKLGSPTASKFDEPWTVVITQQEYPWDMLLVTCVASIGKEKLVTYAWVIAKMKSSRDVPYHPVICSYDAAKCIKMKFDCANGVGLSYRGSHDRSADGALCQPWISQWPNGILHKMFKGWMNPADKMKVSHHFYDGNNFCRNLPLRDGVSPAWKQLRCITAAVKVAKDKLETQYRNCRVPHCHSCMFGLGDGRFHGESKLRSEWHYPKYHSVNKHPMTKLVEYSSSGKKVYRKCHKGKSKVWLSNKCSWAPNVGGRRPPGFTGIPKCLAVVDKKSSEEEGTFSEDPKWPRYQWTPCTARHCTVRQMWFLIIGPDKKVFLSESNAAYVEIPVMTGKDTSIKFFHFGTSLCSGMTLEADKKLRAFLKFLKLKCKPTPQMSEITILQPTRHFEGNYNIRYVFPEGDEIMELTEYKANFKLVVKQATSISLASLSICPGYPAKSSLKVTGSFKLSSNSIKWYYRTDTRWTDVESRHDIFELSSDALTLTMKNIRNGFELNVTAKSSSGDVSTKSKVTVLEVPRLMVKKSNILANFGSEVTLSITCNSRGKTTWLFNSLTISKYSNNDYFFRTEIVDAKRERNEMLIIRRFEARLEGIYTVQVEENNCRTTKTIYVSKK